jgi:hypothetical protein
VAGNTPHSHSGHGYLDRDFRGFSQFLFGNAGVVSTISYDRFLHIPNDSSIIAPHTLFRYYQFITEKHMNNK